MGVLVERGWEPEVIRHPSEADLLKNWADILFNNNYTFLPILKDITVTFNGTTWTEPANYTYNEATGLFTTIAGQITIPAAAYTRDTATGALVINPGASTLTVTGTI